jgi:hypothetical protein
MGFNSFGTAFYCTLKTAFGRECDLFMKRYSLRLSKLSIVIFPIRDLVQSCRYLPMFRRNVPLQSSTMNTEMIQSSETLVTIYKAFRCHKEEDHNKRLHSRQKLISSLLILPQFSVKLMWKWYKLVKKQCHDSKVWSFLSKS